MKVFERERTEMDEKGGIIFIRVDLSWIIIIILRLILISTHKMSEIYCLIL